MVDLLKKEDGKNISISFGGGKKEGGLKRGNVFGKKVEAKKGNVFKEAKKKKTVAPVVSGRTSTLDQRDGMKRSQHGRDAFHHKRQRLDLDKK